MSSPRSALVTGCSTGIGHAVVQDLASRGWQVFATVRKPQDAERLQSEIPECIPVIMDVCDADSVAAACELVKNQLQGQPLHGVVQNAGIACIGPLELLPIDSFETQLNVNLTGVLRVCQAVLPLMRQGQAPKGSRRIVMISSISGKVGTPLAGAYNASKFGLEGMSDALRRELYPQGIDVTLVEPGAIATAIWDTSSERAEQMLPGIEASPEIEHYRPIIDAIRVGVPKIKKRAIPAQSVADAVRKSLESRRPPVRTLVGRDAKFGSLVCKIVPTRILDKFIYRDSLNPR